MHRAFAFTRDYDIGQAVLGGRVRICGRDGFRLRASGDYQEPGQGLPGENRKFLHARAVPGIYRESEHAGRESEHSPEQGLGAVGIETLHEMEAATRRQRRVGLDVRQHARRAKRRRARAGGACDTDEYNRNRLFFLPCDHS